MKNNIPDANRYSVTVAWSDENEGFLARVPALPGCICVMPTEAAAMKEIRLLIKAFLEIRAEDGHPFPKPDIEGDGINEVRRLLPLMNLSKLARATGVNRSTLASRVRRKSKMPASDTAAVRRAVHDLLTK